MKRIMVIGCPGSGKSTLSIRLGGITGLPVYHLDRLNWNPDRTCVAKSVFIDRLTQILGEERWIIDGNYDSSMELRLKACDTVIFLDYPTKVCLDGILSRRGKPRPDMPWIEREGETDSEFISFVEHYNRDSRPRVLSLLQQYADKRILIFRSRAEAEAFLTDSAGGCAYRCTQERS